MAQFIVPQEVYHGVGTLENIKNIKAKKAAVVIGGNSVKRNGFLDRTLAYLQEANIETFVFDGVEADPSIETVNRGAEMFAKEQPDLIVGLGGCSAIDAAKAMWVYYEYPDSKLEDLAKPFGVKKMRNKARFVAIPSTSGTGTEITGLAVITDRVANTKYPIVSHELTPDIAIIDADLCKSMPKNVTAHTGMDALSHSVEAYVSNIADDYCDALAKHGIELVFQYLPQAVAEPENTEVRQKMHNASALGGMAFTNVWLGIVHSMSHQLGGTFGIPHGCANAILMPNVIRYNSQFTSKYNDLAKMLGVKDAAAFADAVEELGASVGIPAGLKAWGISDEDFEKHLDTMVAHAMADPCTLFNPYSPESADIRAIYTACFYGTKIETLQEV